GTHTAANIVGMNVTAAGIAGKNPFDRIDLQVAGARTGVHLGANLLHGNVARARLGGGRQLQAADVLVARPCARGQAGLLRDGYVIVDGDVAGQVAGVKLADGDGTAVLHDPPVLIPLVGSPCGASAHPTTPHASAPV